MKKYNFYLIATIIIAHLCMAALLSYRYWIVRDISDADPFLSQITKFQEQKIEAMKPGEIDTVFLGDSSLGNAINAKLFDTLVGTRSLNLALTGSHGHAGALVFLRKVIAHQPALRNVILFFAVDAMAFGQNKEGRFYMSPSPFESALSPVEQVALLGTYASKLSEGAEALAYIKKAASGHAEVELPEVIYNNDYIVSHAKIAANSENVRDYRLPNIDSPKNAQYLNAMGKLCKKRQLHCVYVQGPIMAELIIGNPAADHLFSTTAIKLQEAGITLVNDRPFLMSEQNRGDSIFHLSHDFRDEFTALYAQKIAPLIEISVAK